MFTQMQVLERLLMIYIQMSRPLLFLITNCRTWRDWSGCLEQHKLSDAPIKGIDHYIAMRNLHIEDAIPSEPLDIHSSGRVLIHGFNSYQNQAGEIVSFYETLINNESTSSKHHPIIRWVPHNEIPPTKLIDCDSWPLRPPRIFVPLPWWPVIQMSNLFMWDLSILFFWRVIWP